MKGRVLFLIRDRSDWVNPLSRRAVDSLFHAIFALTDIRSVLRSTAPSHELGEKEREKVIELLQEVERDIGVLREELLR